jgi:putative spermidine/putrescine transport system ATP-binding protein
MSAPAVQMRRVSRHYGSVAAVEDFDLTIAEGEFVALLGSSGCGKTTTLRMMAGLEQPSSGDIVVKGRRVNDVPVHARNVGMVFQNHALFPHRTAFENIAFGLKYRRVPKPEIARRVARALEVVRLPHVADRLPSQLSGGQQQRIAVARAIVIEPDLLLFDEPLSALDAGLRDELRVELKRIQKTLGITTVFVTHDQQEALSMADRIVVMHGGRKRQEGTPEEIYRAPNSEFVMRFFGRVNTLPGIVTGAAAGTMRVALAEGVTLSVAGEAAPGTKLSLLLRAERLRLVPDDGAPALRGHVTGVDYLGMMVRYDVACGAETFQAIQPAEDTVLPVGTPVALRLRGEDLVLA